MKSLILLETLEDMQMFALNDKSYSWSVQCHFNDETDMDELMARFEMNLDKYSTEEIFEALSIL